MAAKLFGNIEVETDYFKKAVVQYISDEGEDPTRIAEYDHCEVLVDGFSCEVLISGLVGDEYFNFRGFELDNKSDDEVIALLRKAQQVAKFLQYKQAIEWVVGHKNEAPGMFLISKFQEYAEVVKWLTAYADKYSDVKLKNTLNAFAQIAAGQHPRSGYVYCLSDQLGHYKIGFSRNVDARIKQLATQPPFDLVLIAAHHVYDMRQCEAAMHEYYKAFRLRGEWFQLNQWHVDEIVSWGWVLPYKLGKRRES